MSYNKLILKTNAAIEIENTIAHYALINIVLARRIENEIRFGFKTMPKISKVSSAAILKSEYLG